VRGGSSKAGYVVCVGIGGGDKTLNTTATTEHTNKKA